ncbi:MAG: hypothetical protein CBD97_01925 [Pelagibacteraceae bacterium TMED237]|nr:MAG: hypothetical protein CBD97_01925 [Pelagibacteraceae bacterium TMED237]
MWWFCIYYPVKNKSEVDSPNLKETYTKNDHFESENDMKDIMDEDKEMDEEIDNEINKETNNKMNVLPIIDSNKNDNLGIDNYFEVTPAKFCYNGGGGYVKPPTHSQQEYCQKLMSTEGGRNVYYTYSCQPGLFSGRPLNMPARTEESNSCWQNPIKLEGINGLPPLIPEHPPVL